MKEMVDSSETACPFVFNYDATTFKVGDMVSYRVPESFDDMPFVGILLEVHDDHVILAHFGEHETGGKRMRGTLDSRPEVSASEALDE
jgi:hypothetical protein